MLLTAVQFCSPPLSPAIHVYLLDVCDIFFLKEGSFLLKII